MKIKDQEYAYPAEALEILKETEEDNRTHEQSIALENLKRHCKVTDIETLKELQKELSEIESLKNKHIFKILEVMPEYESTVEAMFSKERVRLEEGDIQKIIDICASVETE